MAPASRLHLEQLEERTVPATFNVPWPDAPELTLSFAPDGTDAAGQPSALFRALGAQLPTGAWEEEVLRAFQTWAVAADVNVGVVADGGEPFGTLGLKQGDPRFGDIRIGAIPLGDDVLAAADPYDPFIANTSVGDVFLNSSIPFSVGGQNGSYDLFSVLLHEAGHVLGIGPSSDPNSPMFEQYHKVTGLTPGDVAALRALYGARPPDPSEGATALDLGGGPAVVAADITAPQDADVYRLTVPDGATALDVRLKASGISLLVGRLTVYDASGRVVASAFATDPLHNDVSVHLDGLKAGDVYSVRVEGAADDVFGIGTYQLAIDPHLPPAGASDGGAGAPHYTPPPPTDTLAGAELLATTPGYVEHTYYEAVNSVSGAVPIHTYLVQSPDLAGGLSNVMTVEVNSLGSNDIPLRANIYDAQGNWLDAAVIAGGDGHYEIQVPGVASATDYYVEVTAADPVGVDQEARYEVDIDFALDATHLQTFVNDTLGEDTGAVGRVLQVEEGQQFQFVLSASDWGAAVATGVRMTITDAAGRDVFSLSAASGATRIGTVFLAAGSYTVTFTRDAQPGDPLTPVLFELSGLSQSDNLGPQLRDTTLAPAEAAAGTIPPPSFFWLPADPTNLLGGGATSHGLSAAKQSARDKSTGALDVRLLSPSGAAPAAPRSDLIGRPAAPATSAGEAVIPAPQAAAAGATSLAGSTQAEPAEVTAPGAGLPVALSHVGGIGSTGSTPAEPPQPDILLVAGGTEASAVTEAPWVATEFVTSAEHLPASGAASIEQSRLLWALGLGTAILSSLTIPARWCVAVLPGRVRLLIRKGREPGDVDGKSSAR